MNDNTILRIKVPAHLYESVKKQLTINEAKKSEKAFGDWKVVKEKKLPKDGMKKVEEVDTVEENVTEVVGGLDDPNFIAGVATLLGVGSAILTPYIKALKSAKSPEEKEKVRKSLSGAISKKMSGDMEEAKEEKVEESINEAVDPNLIAGIVGILFGSLPLLYALIKDYRSAKTPEEKKAVFSKAADAINKKMSGNMEEAKEEKVEEVKHEDKKEEEK